MNTSDGWDFLWHMPNEIQWDKLRSVMTQIVSEPEIDAILALLPKSAVEKGTFCFMRHGIKPTWEDPHNMHQGAFSFKVPFPQIYEVWTQIMRAAITDQLGSVSGYITGFTVSPKRQFCVFKIWMNTVHLTQTKGIAPSIPLLQSLSGEFRLHASS
jgi:hypothetical protein